MGNGDGPDLKVIKLVEETGSSLSWNLRDMLVKMIEDIDSGEMPYTKGMVLALDNGIT